MNEELSVCSQPALQVTKGVDPSLLLDRFLSLDEPKATDANILDFAKRYGPLYLCDDHGLAVCHKPVLMTISAVGPRPIRGVDERYKYKWCLPRIERRGPLLFSEPLNQWRAIARRASALLEIATALRLGGNASAELWKEAHGFVGSFRQDYGESWACLDEPSYRLSANLDYWIATADVCVRIAADERSFKVVLGSNPFFQSVFGLIAVQLLLAVTRPEGLTSCSGCGAPYFSRRPTGAGKLVGLWTAKRDYCSKCRDAKVPQRDAARDYRKRRAAQRN